MTIGDRIRIAREKKGYSQADLAELVGYKSRSSINKIEKEGRDIPRSSIVKFAEVLGVSPSYLIGWEDEEKPKVTDSSELTMLPQENVRMIPVYESVSAGFGAYADDYVIDYMPLYIVNDEEAQNTMCIVVTGDSMYPKIEDGDKIQVVRQDWAENGQVVVALIDCENAVVKKLEYGDDFIRLISFNPEYAPREFKGSDCTRVRILGVVKTVIKQL